MGQKIIVAAAMFAAAAKLFASQGITVQTAKAVKVKDEASGKERDAFSTDNVPLGAVHIIAAAQDTERGVVSIVTVDGKKYEAKGSVEDGPDKAKK